MLSLALLGTAFGFTGDEIVAAVERTAQHRGLAMMTKNAPEISEDLYRKAAAGSVQTDLLPVDGHKAKIAYAVGVVDVPIGGFWAAVNDDPSKPKYGRTSYTEVLSGGICGADRNVFMYLPLSFMLTDRFWVLHVQQNKPLQAASGGKVRQMVWESVEPDLKLGSPVSQMAANGMPIAYAKGAWYLTALDDGHTLVEYWTWTDPGGSVPAGIASSFAAGGIKDTYEGMTKLAKAGPRCPIQ